MKTCAETAVGPAHICANPARHETQDVYPIILAFYCYLLHGHVESSLADAILSHAPEV